MSHSLDVVRTMRTLREEADPARKRHLQKPMIILYVAIIESLHYELHKRIE